MSAERLMSVDESIRQLVRDTVREVIREEMSPLARRNAVSSIGVEDGFLSVAKAARVADVAPGTIRAWIRQGRLSAQRAGRVLRVSRRDLAQFMSGASAGPSGVEAEQRAARLFGGDTRLRGSMA